MVVQVEARGDNSLGPLQKAECSRLQWGSSQADPVTAEFNKREDEHIIVKLRC
jgi:hypothetical protein